MTGDTTPVKLTPPLRIAVDIGGTFTDIQILEEKTGRTVAHKTPTDPADPATGLVEGLVAAGDLYGFALSDVATILHGTTIATNAVLQRKWPAGALITTAGFEDVLEIGRHVRRDVYNQIAESQVLMVPRRHRFGIDERIKADGHVERPICNESLDNAIAAIAESGVKAVAVVLLHSYANPRHEHRVRDALLQRLPDIAVSISSEISPEIREYERTATTTLNALLQPVVGAYLNVLQQRLRSAGFGGAIYLVQSNGGVTTPGLAAAQPARLLLSGPSGGAMAAQVLSDLLQMPQLIAVDMGGTSFDVSVVENGEIQTHQEGEVAGLPVRLPMVEMRTIGAGGGSIAQVEAGGRLRVGPESAGAAPGPVAYGRGGTGVTVTDANLVSGRLEPTRFLGGTMPLDSDAAFAAIRQDIAAPLGLSTEAAAVGVAAVSTSAMAGAIKLSLFEKGLDPDDFALLSFGGAGGLHAIDVAEELGVDTVIFPKDPGTLSAWGMLFSDIVQDQARSLVVPANNEHLEAMQQTAEQLQRTGRDALVLQGLDESQIANQIHLDMRYPGQAYDLVVPVSGKILDCDGLSNAVADFHHLHKTRFSFDQKEVTPEVVTVRVRSVSKLSKPAIPSGTPHAPVAKVSCAGKTQRFFTGHEWQSAREVERSAIQPGSEITGPAVIYEPHSTLWIGSAWSVTQDVAGALIARRQGELPHE